MKTDGLQKMLFPFTTADGEEVESMWVQPAGRGMFVVKNIPFYARGVSADDIVRGAPDADGVLRFERVETHGGHSTIRIVLFVDAQRDRVLARLCELGCAYEGSDTPGLFAIDVPRETSWSAVQEALRSLAAEGVLDWEESAISARHDGQS